MITKILKTVAKIIIGTISFFFYFWLELEFDLINKLAYLVEYVFQTFPEWIVAPIVFITTIASILLPAIILLGVNIRISIKINSYKKLK